MANKMWTKKDVEGRVGGVVWGTAPASKVLSCHLRHCPAIWGTVPPFEALSPYFRFRSGTWGTVLLSEVLYRYFRYSPVIWTNVPSFYTQCRLWRWCTGVRVTLMEFELLCRNLRYFLEILVLSRNLRYFPEILVLSRHLRYFPALCLERRNNATKCRKWSNRSAVRSTNLGLAKFLLCRKRSISSYGLLGNCDLRPSFLCGHYEGYSLLRCDIFRSKYVYQLMTSHSWKSNSERQLKLTWIPVGE
jgi:hypothetical protein